MDLTSISHVGRPFPRAFIGPTDVASSEDCVPFIEYKDQGLRESRLHCRCIYVQVVNESERTLMSSLDASGSTTVQFSGVTYPDLAIAVYLSIYEYRTRT